VLVTNRDDLRGSADAVVKCATTRTVADKDIVVIFEKLVVGIRTIL
jgi:hypothetical protein